MWKEGKIGVPGSNTIYKFWAKVYDEPSEESGLNGSRVSKLTIRKLDSTKDLFNYDRGMDKEAQNDEVASIVQIILAKFN